MSSKIQVGVLGATGMVGQNYVRLLEDHPWFEVTYVAASPQSAGKTYAKAVEGRWHMKSDIPEFVENLVVEDAGNIKAALGKCSFVFSALEMGKEETAKLEEDYAKNEIPVVSNASAHRGTCNVPMLIPEINADHAHIIKEQRKAYGTRIGFIAVKPNCSLQSYLTPVYALISKGYNVDRIFVTTLQAVSGAGYPGVASLDMIDNIVPYIKGEEEKTEEEPLKILGKIEHDFIEASHTIAISATCTRVPVLDGHMACVSLGFSSDPPSLDDIIRIWNRFRSVPQELGLPSAPDWPIIYREEFDRPQPRKDRDAENGMAVTVGRLRECSVLDVKFVGLSHNTVRGAAGGGILNAELLKEFGYLE